MQQQSSGTIHIDVQTGTSSVPISPNDQQQTTNLNPSIGENGSLFTLTNIYTFGGNDSNSFNSSTDLLGDKYRIKSLVEVFDQPSSQQDSDYERHYRETHSSSSYTRRIRRSETDAYDYGDSGNYDAKRYQHIYESATPVNGKFIHGESFVLFVLMIYLFV